MRPVWAKPQLRASLGYIGETLTPKTINKQKIIMNSSDQRNHCFLGKINTIACGEKHCREVSKFPRLKSNSVSRKSLQGSGDKPATKKKQSG